MGLSANPQTGDCNAPSPGSEDICDGSKNSRQYKPFLRIRSMQIPVKFPEKIETKNLIIAALGLLILIAGVWLLFFQQAAPSPSTTANQSANQTACPSLYQPVCGTDNKTYSNSCIANYSGTAVAYNGTCTAIAQPSENGTCSDSDAGKDILSAGSASKAGETKSDTCANATSVLEYYCQNGSIAYATVDCPVGYACSQGACSFQAANATNISQCMDTDQGKDFQATGAVFYNGKEYLDYCYDAHSLKEYYCENNAAAGMDYDCPTDRECIDGSCVQVTKTCFETDAGIDKFNNGVLSVFKNKALISEEADYCLNSTHVNEYYCQNGGYTSIALDCGSGFECKGGECVSVGAVPALCNDSDGGKDVYAKGTATNGTVTGTDICKGSDIVEYYCDNGAVKSSQLACPSGSSCSNGVCAIAMIPVVCNDSDGGNDIYTAGTASDATKNYSDYCPSKSSIVEYYCDSSKMVQNTTTSCSSGYGCFQGRCEYLCTDSDGGYNTSVKGTAKKGTASYTDYCIDSSTVDEYYCEPKFNTLLGASYACPANYSCIDGACSYFPLIPLIIACTDPDGPYDTTTKSTVTDSSGSYTDYCTPSGWVRDYACANSTTHTYYDIQCAAGKTCASAVCK